MCDQCVFGFKYFLSSILFWANWREFPWDAIICVWKGSDSLWLTSHSDRNQCYNQLSSRYWSVLKSLSAEYDLVVPEKMSCYQILPCALQAILNSHPFGSRHQKSMEHMLCCEHMALWKTVAVVLLCPMLLLLLLFVLPLDKPNTLIFAKTCQNPSPFMHHVLDWCRGNIKGNMMHAMHGWECARRHGQYEERR